MFFRGVCLINCICFVRNDSKRYANLVVHASLKFGEDSVSTFSDVDFLLLSVYPSAYKPLLVYDSEA